MLASWLVHYESNTQAPIITSLHVVTSGKRFLDMIGTGRSFWSCSDERAEEFHLRLHGYVLMSNHYHLLVETPQGGLNRALRYLNGVYTQTFNRRHRRIGHLFQGRYKAILVDKDSYLLELSRYVHLNPWRLKRSQDPFTYHWSSLGAYVGQSDAPKWLTVTEILSYFGSSGKRRYREFVVEGMKSGIKTPWEEIRGQVVIGSEEFVEEAARKHVRGKNNQRSEESRLREIVGVKPDALLRAIRGQVFC